MRQSKIALQYVGELSVRCKFLTVIQTLVYFTHDIHYPNEYLFPMPPPQDRAIAGASIRVR